MHAVGIKRVFWTNSRGAWEGAKVRGLVDALEGGRGDGKNNGSGTAMKAETEGLFVTKHEVLMLRRIMGAEMSMAGSVGHGNASGGKASKGGSESKRKSKSRR